MAFDYSKFANTAVRMVKHFGVEVTLMKNDATAANSAKPWEGPTNKESLDGATRVEVSAVFLEPADAERLGLSHEMTDMLRRSSRIAIIAPAINEDEDFSEFQTLKESDTVTWRISAVHTLKPASTTLVYYMGLVR